MGRLTGAPGQPRTVYCILEGASLATVLPAIESFKPVSVESRSTTVADRIVEAVAAGQLLPGRRLVEQEMADRLAVSRVPLREAMKTLCAQGILVAEPHRGTRVAGFGDAWAAAVRRARLALERLAFRDAASVLRAEPKRTRELHHLIDDMDRDAGRGDWLSAIRADLAFHRSVVAAGGDEIVVTLWETLARHVMIVFGQETRLNRSEHHLAEEHRALLTTLMEASPDVLDREVERHILRIPRSIDSGGMGP